MTFHRRDTILYETDLKKEKEKPGRYYERKESCMHINYCDRRTTRIQIPFLLFRMMKFPN
jgi:hypothetical protein